MTVLKTYFYQKRWNKISHGKPWVNDHLQGRSVDLPGMQVCDPVFRSETSSNLSRICVTLNFSKVNLVNTSQCSIFFFFYIYILLGFPALYFPSCYCARTFIGSFVIICLIWTWNFFVRERLKTDTVHSNFSTVQAAFSLPWVDQLCFKSM